MFTFTRSSTLASWTNLEGDRPTSAHLEELLARHGHKLTVQAGRHVEHPTAAFVAETFAADTGEPWEWAYVGDDRLKLEAAVATWLLVEDDLDGARSCHLTVYLNA